jgi:glyoxylase-like metal-dependent hydrolase (beta-lactamase superfamily II)
MTYEPESLYAGLPPEETGPAVGPLVNDRGLVPVPYHPLLVRTAAGLALIDTGAGLALAEEAGEPVGRLPQALAAAGVAADDVALVLLSHAHPDHIGGLTTANGTGRRLVFPRARHVIGRAEYQYWTRGQVPADFAWMGELARQHLVPVEQAGLLDLVEGEQEVAPGIRVVPAPGHTPGHLAIGVTSGSQQAIFLADAVLGEANFAHPGWTSVFDTDRAQAARTRRQLLDAAARATAIVAGYHLWGPGMAERHAGAYRWEPLR